jgi:hypothetical protein
MNISAIIVADVVRRFSPDQLRMKFSIHTGVGNRLKHFLAPRHGDQSGKHSRASAHIFSVESRQQPLNVRST